MRKVFFILAISLFSLHAGAQMAPLTSLLIKDGWSQGYYYDNSGKKISGILKDYIPINGVFKEHFDYLYFKTTDTSDKKKIQASDIESFVVGVDTFTVTHYGLLINKPFLQVLINENIKLYASDIKNTTSVAGGLIADRYVKSIYYFGPDPDNITPIKNKNFQAAMKLLLVNYPELLQKIQNKEYEFDDMESIINYYNGMKMEAASKKDGGK